MPGYIIAEQHGIYPLFSGHNTICVVTALLETGQLHMVEPLTEFKLEAPGGLISIEAECEVTHHCVFYISLVCLVPFITISINFMILQHLFNSILFLLISGW